MFNKLFDIDICMVVHNDLTRDSRVRKEAASLAANGLSVVVVAITRRGYNLPRIETTDGFTIFRVAAPNWYRFLSRSAEDFLNADSISNTEQIEQKDRVITDIKNNNLAVSNQKMNFDIFVKKLTNKLINIPNKIISIPNKLFVKIVDKIYSKFLNLTSYSAICITLLSAIFHLRKVRAKAYHAHDFPGLLQLAISGKWKAPKVYDSHELFFDQWSPEKPPIIYRWLQPLEKYLAKKTVGVITVSEGIADRLAIILDVSRPLVIRNTVVLDKESQPAIVYPTSGYRTVVHSGMITIARHLPEMVKSLTYLPSDVVLVLMGEGSLTAELSELAQEIGVADRLKIVPPVDTKDVAPTLAQADVGLILITSQNTHYDYSLPNKFFECIAAGLPLVVSPCKEIAELTNKYSMGEICDPNDPKEIALAILRVLEPENFSKYKNNVDIARGSYLNWEVEEKKLIDIYHKLLG